MSVTVSLNVDETGCIIVESEVHARFEHFLVVQSLGSGASGELFLALDDAGKRAYLKRKRTDRKPRCEAFILHSVFEQPSRADAADIYAAGFARERGGDGQPACWREAFPLYQLAFDLGHAPAALKLGVAYVRGMNAVAVDYELAYRYFEQAYKAKVPQAAALYASRIYYGEGCARNKAKAIDIWRSDPFDPLSQYYLSFEPGESSMSFECANELQKMAEDGCTFAQHCMGYCLDQGHPPFAKDSQQSFKWYAMSLAQGNLQTARNLAVMYLESTPPQREKAFETYLRVAQLGVRDAMHDTGWCLEYGRGTPKDIHAAFKWYKKAADLGDADGEFALGQCYAYAIAVKRDYAEAVKWLNRAVAQDHLEAQVLLADCLLEGREGVPADKQRAFDLLSDAAHKGNKTAQRKIAQAYYFGNGTDVDHKQVVHYLRLAAEQDDAEALFAMGNAYSVGLALERDEKKAIEYWQRAVDSNSHEGATIALARVYLLGSGTARDIDKGIALLTPLAEKNNDIAQIWLGTCYHEMGQQEQAQKWIQRAEQNASESEAFNLLGRCYDDGIGVAADSHKAFSMFERAAEDDAAAMYNVALCYEYGKGCKRNLALAKVYYSRAAAAGIDSANEKLDRPWLANVPWPDPASLPVVNPKANLGSKLECNTFDEPA